MTSDLETAAKANDVASNSSLAPAERVIQLRQMAEGVKNVELLGQIEGYIGSLELQREAQAMEQGLNRVALRENANIRDYLIETGRVTADDLDKAGYLSHAELDAREADGTLSEAIDLTLREGMARKALRWEKGFEKGGEFRPTRGGDAGRRVTKALPTGREDASRKAEKPPAKGKAPQAGKALPDPPESDAVSGIVTRTVYRSGAESMPPPVDTAKEVIDHEISLGNKDVKPYPGVDPTKVPAGSLYWVTLTPEQSKEYEPEGESEPEDAMRSWEETFRVIATDKYGGYLIQPVSPPESPGIDSIQSQLAEVRKFGLNDWPEIGERGRELLGTAKDTQELHTQAHGAESPGTAVDKPTYTDERRVLHSKIKGEVIAGLNHEKTAEEGKPVYEGGLVELLGLDNPITQKCLTEGLDSLTKDERKQIRDAASKARGGKKPTALFMAGGPASGKTSGLNQAPELKPESAISINSDDVKVLLPEFIEQKNAGERAAAATVHEESSDVSKDLVADASDLGLNVVMDGTGNSKPGKFIKKLDDLYQDGYEIDVLLVSVGTDEAVVRAMNRAQRSGRWVPEPEIRKSHKLVSANMESVIAAPWIRSVTMYENAGSADEPPTLMGKGERGEFAVADEPAISAFWAKATEPDYVPPDDDVPNLVTDLTPKAKKGDKMAGSLNEGADDDHGEFSAKDVPMDKWQVWPVMDSVDYLDRPTSNFLGKDGTIYTTLREPIGKFDKTTGETTWFKDKKGKDDEPTK
jgi:hypothetical protein